MENLKQYLAVLKKYQFWVVCVLVALTALACYTVASGGLARTTNERIKTLQGQFNAVKVDSSHPNQDTIAGVEKKNETLKRSVFEAWEALYQEQKKNNVLPSVLDENFKTAFEKLGSEPTDGPDYHKDKEKDKDKCGLEPVYLSQYQNIIEQELPTLLKLVDARRPPDDKGPAAAPGAAAKAPAGPPAIPGKSVRRAAGPARPGVGQGRTMLGGEAVEEDLIGVVDWNADYESLYAEFSRDGKGFRWQGRVPRTIEIVIAQENLWVLQALLRVIHNTNVGATSNAMAAVKRIDAIQLGHAAAAAWKRSVSAAAAPVGGGKGEGGGGGKGGGGFDADSPMGGGGKGGGDMPMMGGTAAPSDESYRQLLIEGRYFDDKEEPVPFSADTKYYATHPYEEFVMMPIRMLLFMDQRRVPKLLVECANSSMPIEVRQLRMVTTGMAELDMGAMSRGGGFGGGGKGGGGKGGGGRDDAPMRGFNAPRGAQSAEASDASPYDVPVEILAIIKIYHPPIREKAADTGPTDQTADASAAAKNP